MRIIFGILSFGAAGLLAMAVTVMVQEVVLPYLLQGQSTGFSLMRLGPIHFYEPQICILAAVLALLVIALIVAGIYAFTGSKFQE